MKDKIIKIEKLKDVYKITDQVVSYIVNEMMQAYRAASIKWDYLHVEIWEDSGKFIMYLSENCSEKRNDITCLAIICEEIAIRVQELDFDDELSDKDHNREVNKIIRSMAASFKESIGLPLDGYHFQIFNQDNELIGHG